MQKIFNKYANHILKYNKVHMLTGFKTLENVQKELFQNSVKAFQNINLDNKKLLDIGTGCGIPGIPLKINNQKLKLTLLEVLTKRVKFLKEVKKYVDFNLIHGRAEEEALNYKEKFDVVTMRAFSHNSICLEIGSQFLKINGLLVLIKGPKAKQEIKEAKNAALILKFKLNNIYELKDEKNTNVIVYKKVDITPDEYPRSFKKIKNKKL